MLRVAGLQDGTALSDGMACSESAGKQLSTGITSILCSRLKDEQTRADSAQVAIADCHLVMYVKSLYDAVPSFL